MIVVNSRGELKNLINRRIEERGPNCDLNDIDVSRIKNMRSSSSALISTETSHNGILVTSKI